MDATTKLQRSTDVTYQVVAEEAILIRMQTGTYFSLNQIGTEFWDMLDGTRTLGQLAQAVADKYAVEESRVLSDFLELAGKMLADNLVVVLA